MTLNVSQIEMHTRNTPYCHITLKTSGKKEEIGKKEVKRDWVSHADMTTHQ